MAGRPAKFIQEHLMNGNPSKLSKAELNAHGLQAYGDILEADYIPEDAIQAVALIKASMPPGVFASLDTFLVNAFAVAWAIHKKATENMFFGDVEGGDFTGEGKFIITNKQSGSEAPSGWYKIFESSTRLMSTLATQLGLDPRARQQMSNPINLQTEEDDLLGNARHD